MFYFIYETIDVLFNFIVEILLNINFVGLWDLFTICYFDQFTSIFNKFNSFSLVLDTNDRFLRKITIGQSSTEKGFAREVNALYYLFLKLSLQSC